VNSKANNKIQGFLINDDFINYIVNPNLILKEIWDDFFKSHPEMIPIATEAKNILLGQNLYCDLTMHDTRSMENKILEKCGIMS
jgi:hypothetical protein